MKTLILFVLLVLGTSCTVDRGLYSNNSSHPTTQKVLQYHINGLVVKH